MSGDSHSTDSTQGAVPSGVLSPVLRRLTEQKRVVAVDTPLSVRPSKPALHRVADSNLRCYLTILRDVQRRAEEGERELGMRIIQRRWSSWRGRALEPLIRASLRRAGIRERLPWEGVETVGGWWNRQFQPGVDLVGADKAPVADRIHFAGSVKWMGKPFDGHGLAELHRSAAIVPGFTPGVVSLSGLSRALDASTIDLVWQAHDLVAVWEVAA